MFIQVQFEKHGKVYTYKSKEAVEPQDLVITELDGVFSVATVISAGIDVGLYTGYKEIYSITKVANFECCVLALLDNNLIRYVQPDTKAGDLVVIKKKDKYLVARVEKTNLDNTSVKALQISRTI